MITINLGKRKRDLWIVSLDTLIDEDLIGRKTVAKRLKIANQPSGVAARIWPRLYPKALVLLVLDKAKEGSLHPWVREE